MLYYIIFFFSIFMIGIFLGSFLNVCIYRLPKEESVIKKPSHCLKCGTKIKMVDLFPIFSWIKLKGKCRMCHEKFSIRYPLVELLNGVLWIFSFLIFGITIKALIISLLFSTLVLIFFMDFDTQLISIGVVNFIGILAILNFIFVKDVSLTGCLIGALVVSLPLLLLNVLSGGRAMGFGDVYLMAAAGLFLGIKGVAVAMFLGLVLGSIGGLINKYLTDSSRFAFGPYLALGIAVSSIWGEQIFNAYLHFARLG